MKKIFALLMILVLTGPAIGLACDCCPMTGAASDHSQVVRTSHDCCPMLDINREKCGIERTGDKLLPASSGMQVSGITSNGEVFSILGFSNPSLNESGPPLFSPEIPLYLAHRVFRL